MRYFSRVMEDGWNQFITHLTGGLLYGREVRRPPEFPTAKEARVREKDRADAHAKVVTRKSASKARRVVMTPRRKKVMEMMLERRSFLEMAAATGTNKSVINNEVEAVRKFHGVGSTEELAEKLGRTLPPKMLPKRRKVMEMLLSDLSEEEIARRMGMRKATMQGLALKIYAQMGVGGGRGGRGRLREKIGVVSG